MQILHLLLLFLLQLNQPRLFEDFLIEPDLVLVHEDLQGAGLSAVRAPRLILYLPLYKALVLTQIILTLLVLDLLVPLV